MQFVTRAEWGARPTRGLSNGNLNQAPTLHWNGPNATVGGKFTWDHKYCAGLVRGIQNYHMDANKWNDIAYNFIACPHRYIFEGRGLNKINAANGTNVGNRTSHGIMNLAGPDNPFSNDEKLGVKECVSHISRSVGAPNSCRGHRDHKSTSCPGDERYSWVKAGMPIGSTPQPTPPSPKNPPAPPKPIGNPLLRVGSRGDSVRRVQRTIKNALGMSINVDGIFGQHTKLRVQQLQAANGLSRDGIVGPKTWAVIERLEKSGSKLTNARKPQIRRGAKGEVVRYLQDVISRKAGGDILVDGIFGAGTERRVKDAQRLFGLAQDGIVGPKTWNVIDFLAQS